MFKIGICVFAFALYVATKKKNFAELFLYGRDRSITFTNGLKAWFRAFSHFLKISVSGFKIADFQQHLTSKPIEPTLNTTLKADLVAFINSDVLNTKIIGKSAQGLCVTSTSASKFEFLELPIGTGSTQFESKI